MSAAPADRNAVTISLLGREFRVACPEGEQKQLMASVDYLNRRMKEVRDTGKVVGNERIAIMAALNIAHELMSNPGKASSPSVDNTAIKRRIVAMQETLDAALAADQENLF
jgi:cell division protein ZapA